jgi:hypothetical protein
MALNVNSEELLELSFIADLYYHILLSIAFLITLARVRFSF